MRRVAAALVLVLAPVAHAGDEERAFVEVLAERTTCYVQQPVRVRLRFGLEKALLAEGVIPLFRQQLDLPVHVTAPWFDGLTGNGGPGRGGEAVSFALNDGAAFATRVGETERDGRAFAVFEIGRVLRPVEAGTTGLVAPRLRFVYATRFEDDFLNGRVPVDRHQGAVQGTPVTLEVRGLPEKGRPEEFTGAVGQFTVSASADRSKCAVGETVRWTLVIEGQGNLGQFDAPALDDVPGFHLLGVLDDKGTPRRAVTYDFAPQSASVTEIPSIPFAYFDPGPAAAYRVILTSPVPLEVEQGAAPSAPAAVVGPTCIEEEPEEDIVFRTVLALVLVTLSILVLLHRRGDRARGVPDQETARAQGAAAIVREELAVPGASVADALARFLAAHLRCEPAAVISPDLLRRLTAAGVDTGLGTRTAAMLEQLVAERYGGGPAGEGVVDAALALVDELDRALAERRSRS